MKYALYSMRDLKTGFLAPNCDQNDVCAIRNFDTAIKRSNDILHFHKEDFQIYKIGYFDSESGLVESVNPPELICDGGSFDE